MIVEVIAVGTELLIGQRVNTNAAHISARLAREGFDSHYQVVVGDNLSRLEATIATGLERSDAIILTGGIGPTHDDVTREAICAVTERTLVRDEEHASWIAERMRSQGREPSPNQMRMADLPDGAEGVPNPAGVALGVGLQHHGKLVFALPGVPAEMKPMLDEHVIPRLRALAGGPSVLRSRVIKLWGLGESSVSNELEDLVESNNPSVGLLIRDMEVEIRVTAKADDWDGAGALIEPLEAEIVSRLGNEVFGYDDDTVESLIAAMLSERSWTLSTAEQATLGGVGARLADVLGERFGGTVIPGATGGADAIPADVRLRIGPIGPGRSEGKRLTRPVEIEVATPGSRETRVFEFGGNTERIRSFATIAGLHTTRIALSG
jgi:nicotinamide-nucleotide amidase